MASSYYNSSGKEVSDGDIAYADDLNSINNAVDAAFQLAETDITGMVAEVEAWSDLAEGFANSADADATQTAADRVQTGLDRDSATNSANSATSSASSASTSASTATTKAALAEQWAEEDEDVAVTTGKYSAKHWAAKAAADAGIQTLTGTGVDNTDPNNPVISITKTTISLGNVDNTSDINKPISTTTQAALDLKSDISSFILSSSSNGYHRSVDGFLVQWGSFTSHSTPGESVSVTFPLAFTTAYQCFATPRHSATTIASAWTVALSNTGVDVKCNIAGVTVRWLAVGRIA